MKALVQDIYGTSDVLRLDDVDRPEPAGGEVLVRIAAASVNAADWHIMRGEPRVARLMDRSIFGRTGPRERIRGRDFAGTIEALGPGVTGWQVGDEVLGEDDATLAEYAAVPQACLARKPDGAVVRGGRGPAPGRRHRRPVPHAGPGRRRAPRCWSSGRRAGWARSPSSSPPRAAPRSPASAAPATSTS